MENEELKIKKWITRKEAEDKKENGLGSSGGFFECGMRWEDYKNRFKKIVHSMLEELRRSIIENHIKWSGEAMQDYGYDTVPLWSNGKVDIYSWRGWGDLMAAVWSSEEDKDYCYMDFYMDELF